jgi:hypothetical protein
MLDPKQVIDLVQSKRSYLAHNYMLIDIFENNLLPYIDCDMKKQFSLQMYEQAKIRTVPINILPKIIDKLTGIYNRPVLRAVIDGSPKDKELQAWYQYKLRMNVKMNSANEFFNLCKSTLIQPYIYQGVPYLRNILNDKFLVYSENEVDSTIPTYVIIISCEYGKEYYTVYSDTEFMICNSDGQIEYQMMQELYNEEGINPLGIIPFVYINSSQYRLYPKTDEDIIKLTKIIPIMLTDLNVAAMFQAFSIMYGIDLDDENLKMSPNAFWRLKSDPTSDKKPELGMLKPQVDYAEVLNLIQSELMMWLGTKGIRASSVGSLTQENFSSGISKVIDEMDTYEARQKQIPFFESGEAQLWDLILKYMHPHWVKTGQIDNKALFDPNAFVQTVFAEQLPIKTRGEVVKEVREEFAAGFISRKNAIKKLNPGLGEDELQKYIEEIDEERGFNKQEQIEQENDQEDQMEDTQEEKDGGLAED